MEAETLDGLGRRRILGDDLSCNNKVCFHRRRFFLGRFHEFCETHALVDGITFGNFLEKDRTAKFFSQRDRGERCMIVDIFVS